MITTISARALKDALTPLKNIISKKPLLPALSCVKVESLDDVLTVSGLDLEVYRQNVVEVEVERDGAVLVNFQKLMAATALAAKSLTEPDVTLTADHHALTFRHGRNRLQLPLLPLADAPAWPSITSVFQEAPLEALKRAVKATLFAVPEKDPTLENCRLHLSQDGAAVAMTSSWIVRMGSGTPTMSLSPRAARGLQDYVEKMEIAYISQVDGLLQLSGDAGVFLTKYAEPPVIPTIKQILPEEPAVAVTVKTEELRAVLAHATLIKEEALAVTVHFCQEGLIFKAEESGCGAAAATIESDAVGSLQDFEVRVNGHFLIQALRAFREVPELTIKATAALQPLVIEAEGGLSLVLAAMQR